MELADSAYLTPKDFIDLGCSSLAEICFNAPLNLADGEDIEEPQEEITLGELGNCNRRLIHLYASEEKAPVLAIDTTNTDLGQTRHGFLCAVRGTVVKVEGKRYEYTRYGPFLFHITHANRQILYNSLRQTCLGEEGRRTAPPLEKMAERIRSILEEWLQRQTALSNRDAIILWDGSLAASATSGSVPITGQMLREARERGNCILALSKKTTLTVRDGVIHDLIGNAHAPSMLDIDEEARSNYFGRLHFLGHVYAAKLTLGRFTFRLDIDRGLSTEEAVQSVERLLASDILRENYPETLRLAHVLSRFSAAEILGMQRFIGECYGLRFSNLPSIREVIFGPFEGSGIGQRQGVSTL